RVGGRILRRPRHPVQGPHPRRQPAPRHLAGEAREAPARVRCLARCPRDDDGRQLDAADRRRLDGAVLLAGVGGGARAADPGEVRRRRDGRRRLRARPRGPAHGTGRRRTAPARPQRPGARGHRLLRDPRGVRLHRADHAGGGGGRGVLPHRARPGRRDRQGRPQPPERERLLARRGPPVRGDGRPHHRDGGQARLHQGPGDGAARTGPDLDLRRRWPGRRRPGRVRLSARTHRPTARFEEDNVTDSYLTLANGTLKPVFKKLGLPQPAILRRYRPGSPLTVGPVLVVADDASAADADAVAKTLSGWDVDVRREAGDTPGERFGAVVLVLTGARTPEDVSAPVLTVAGTLRRLAGNGRVLTISRAVADGDAPVLAATRGGVDGLVRSLGKELRGGSTSNGILLTDDAAVDSASAVAALRFFLSAKSAYVDGQLLPVGPADVAGPVDWEQPLAGKVGVVTGDARGIGAAIARTMARDGAKVVVIDVPQAGEALAAVANEIGGVALQL